MRHLDDFNTNQLLKSQNRGQMLGWVLQEKIFDLRVKGHVSFEVRNNQSRKDIRVRERIIGRLVGQGLCSKGLHSIGKEIPSRLVSSV